MNEAQLLGSERVKRHLNVQDIKTLSLATLGGALEFYDFIIFILFARIFVANFFPAEISPFLGLLNVYGTFAVAYFMRPVGGIIMAHFGDLLGRKKMFTVSIMLMAIATVGIGLLPTYNQIGYLAPILLLLLRMVQGAAIGGEIPSALVFVTEHVPAKNGGLANGLVTAGLVFGILLGSLMALSINMNFSQEAIAEYAWRIPFIVGGIFGFITMYLRRYLHETPTFKEMQAMKFLSKEYPIKTVYKRHKNALIFSMLLTWTYSVGMIIILFASDLMKSPIFNIPAQTVIGMQSMAIVAMTIGSIFTGYLCDRIGTKTVLIIMSVLMMSSAVYFYTGIGMISISALSFRYILLAFFGGLIGGIPYLMVRAFPAKIRLTGVSTSYNIAYALAGGLAPFLLITLRAFSPIGDVFYVIALGILVITCCIYMNMPQQNENEEVILSQETDPKVESTVM